MALPKNVKIFDIRTQEMTDKQSGEKIVKPKVVFNSDIEVFYKGEKVDLGQFKGGFLKRKDELVSGLEDALSAGKLDEDYVQKQIDFIDEKKISSVFEVYTAKKA